MFSLNVTADFDAVASAMRDDLEEASMLIPSFAHRLSGDDWEDLADMLGSEMEGDHRKPALKRLGELLIEAAK